MMSGHSHGMNWYLAQFKPNCHHLAKRNLERQGFQTFLPLLEETYRWRGRFMTEMRPLFPGYIFLSFDLQQGSWRAARSTHGITRLVSFGAEPTIVPTQVVSQMMLRCDRNGHFLPPRILKSGERVRLTKGPFAGFTATIEGMAPERRIWVLLELMGHNMRVATHASDLRAA